MNKKQRKKNLVTSKEVLICLPKQAYITDPCYKEDVINQGGGLLADIKPGHWSCCTLFDNEEKRILRLMANHVDHDYIGLSDSTEVLGAIGVDSGQAGIFDADYYRKNVDDKQWYSQKPCRATSTALGFDSIDGVAVVSSSGWGDGCYAVHVSRDEAGVIVNITIVF